MLELDKNTFEAEVLKAEGKVLVDFYGDGCVPCAALMPHVCLGKGPPSGHQPEDPGSACHRHL